MKNIALFGLFVFSMITNNSLGQSVVDIRFGDNASKWSKYLTPIDACSTCVCQIYIAKENIPTVIWGHTIEKAVLSFDATGLVRKIFIFYPNPGDIDVPKEMLDNMQENLGYKFGHIVNSEGSHYGLKIDNSFMVVVSRSNCIFSEGKDRIQFQMGNVGACK